MTIGEDLELTRIVSDAMMARLGRDARFYCIKRMADETLATDVLKPVIAVYPTNWDVSNMEFEEVKTVATWMFQGPDLAVTKNRGPDDFKNFRLGERLRVRRCTCGSHAVNPGLEASRHPNHCDLRKS